MREKKQNEESEVKERDKEEQERRESIQFQWFKILSGD